MTRAALPLDDFRALVGTEVGVSDWVLVDQARIDAFAECTGDHQFIHVDPVRAAATPFGTTIAHGYLTLSLIPMMTYASVPSIEGAKMGVNYGLNKLRLHGPGQGGQAGPRPFHPRRRRCATRWQLSIDRRHHG